MGRAEAAASLGPPEIGDIEANTKHTQQTLVGRAVTASLGRQKIGGDIEAKNKYDDGNTNVKYKQGEATQQKEQKDSERPFASSCKAQAAEDKTSELEEDARELTTLQPENIQHISQMVQELSDAGLAALALDISDRYMARVRRGQQLKSRH